ncbi:MULTISPECIES: chemotaxis protein CheW [Oceanotoga]|uniref:chemotaxis protein CheW n=1 Tax=Oceanotoga TaxID=1255275 RepID=UPI002655471F|nr:MULTISPECIES: chemotaxis protein CheW [Oceanotoga]MDN5343368.1 purine-binding chemotaxis protein CheW [Oceanotoga sp.]MDO7975738.1 chemotaxis protein CheW [Oceanotoga teriensis]
MSDIDLKKLTFKLDEEIFGISVCSVKTIIGMMNITRVPRTPNYVKGIINLRGKVIPVVDLRIKFEMKEKTYTERTCIIVVEIFNGDNQKLMGLIVDDVSEVITLTEEYIESPPEYGLKIQDEFLIGMAKYKEKVIMLIDINKVLSVDEKNLIKDLGREE